MNDWKENNNELHKTFVFNTFKDAIDWMVNAHVEIEKQQHHPIWTNAYNKVHVSLSTQDAGNKVTSKDWKLAKALDLIAERGFVSEI